MNFITIFLIAIGLASDAFVVAITKGMAIKATFKQALIIALIFGGFESIMIILGWFIGTSLVTFVSTWAPWIAFVLLSAIGIKMIYDSFLGDKDDNDIFSFKEIFLLAMAVTIDAFVVGISFALLKTPILTPFIIIGCTTFTLSFIGVYLGKRLGHLFGQEIEILGGVILIGMGIFILIS